MSKIVYNEGRVVGLSAYEVYVRHALSVDPSHIPASEKEWLASMMAMGSSMLLHVGTDNISGVHYRDIQMPEDTRLCAANNIIGSLFLGSGYINPIYHDGSNAWATKVLDYGPLIENTSTSSPTGLIGLAGDIPPTHVTSIDYTPYQQQIKEYLKIIDGIVIQPGNWSDNASGEPAKDFSPTMYSYPRLRIAFNGPVTSPFFLLLTGFTNRAVADGTVGYNVAEVTPSPSDGDFLGPAIFPWASKIIFTSIPASIVSQYTRALPATSTAVAVDAAPIIDMTIDPKSYYQENDVNSAVDINVTHIHTTADSAAILTTYSNVSTAPPALYGAKISSPDEASVIDNMIYPIDAVAPGNLKLYRSTQTIPITEESADQSAYKRAVDMEKYAPGTTAFMRDEGSPDSSYVVYQLNQNNSMIPVSDDRYASLYGALTVSEPIMPYISCQHNLGDEPNSVGFGIVSSIRLYGRLSAAFEADFGFQYNSTKLNALISYDVNASAYNNIPAANRNQYYYILRGPKNGASQGAQWAIIPVRKSDGTIDYIDKRYYNSGTGFAAISWIEPHVRRKFDSTAPDGWVAGDSGSYAFPSADTTYYHYKPNKDGLGNWVYDSNGYIEWVQDTLFTSTETSDYNSTKSNTEFMGSWWTSESGIADHQTLIDYLPYNITATAHIVDSTRYVPSGSITYPDWQVRYANTPVSSLANGSAIVNALYEDYRTYTVAELVQTARLYDLTTGEAVTYYDSNNQLCVGRLVETWIAPVSNVAESDIDLADTTCTLRFSVALNAANQYKTNVIPIPQNYQSTEGPLATISIAGNHQTMSLSMADASNTPYQLTGTSDTILWDAIARGTLHWDDIVDALAHNKSIDLLGPKLRDLQVNVDGSGNQYIQMKNSPRLYIASSAPTGTIPEGSIGIGW